MRNPATFFGVLATVLLFVSCGGTAPPPSPKPAPSPSPPSAPPAAPTKPTAAVDAAKLYEGNCAVCHGSNRQGVPNIGPSLSRDTLTRRSDGDIRSVITDGKTGTAMAGFKGRLTPEEIEALVQLLRR